MRMKFLNIIRVNVTQKTLKTTVKSLRVNFVASEVIVSSKNPKTQMGMPAKIRIIKLDFSSLL